MSTGALEPINLSDVRQMWDENKPEPRKQADEEDQQLSSLSKHAGWRVLRDHIVGLKAGLDARLSESVLASSPADQIKTDAIFAVLGKSLLESIINKVDDAVEEVDGNTTEGK